MTLHTHSAAWADFDRRVYWAVLTDWLALAAVALIVVGLVCSTHVNLHRTPTPAYSAPRGVWCRLPDGGLVHRAACR